MGRKPRDAAVRSRLLLVECHLMRIPQSCASQSLNVYSHHLETSDCRYGFSRSGLGLTVSIYTWLPGEAADAVPRTTLGESMMCSTILQSWLHIVIAWRGLKTTDA